MLLNKTETIIKFLYLNWEYVLGFIFTLFLYSFITDKSNRISLICFLKDHVKIYRSIKGGKWGQINGYWEQLIEVDADGHIFELYVFKRGYVGYDCIEKKELWLYEKILQINSTQIAMREDYTK